MYFSSFLAQWFSLFAFFSPTLFAVFWAVPLSLLTSGTFKKKKKKDFQNSTTPIVFSTSKRNVVATQVSGQSTPFVLFSHGSSVPSGFNWQKINYQLQAQGGHQCLCRLRKVLLALNRSSHWVWRFSDHLCFPRHTFYYDQPWRWLLLLLLFHLH